MTSGYSGTPLIKKLGLKAGQNVAIAGAPAGYLGLVGPLPEGISLAEAGNEPLDFAHTFVTARAELEQQITALLARIASDGMIWVS
jgi:hypothetical protein